MYSNYPQYATAYPQYFDNHSEYNEKYYTQYNNNWGNHITRNMSFAKDKTDTILEASRVSVTDFIEIFGNIKITTFNSNWNNAFTICVYDKNKKFLKGLPLGTEKLGTSVQHLISYKDGYYMRIRSTTARFLNQTVKIERGWRIWKYFHKR